MRRPRRRPRKLASEHDCLAARRSAALAAELNSQAADGKQYVLIGRVLEALDPGGLRSAPPPDPRADPLTGCLPVTAEVPDALPGP